MLCAAPQELEEISRPTGFFHNKARLIREACFTLSEKYDGRLPDTIEELVTLKGVGRKTANVIVGHCYGKPAVVVDTHCIRVSRRLGLTLNTDPLQSPEKKADASRNAFPSSPESFLRGATDHPRRFSACKSVMKGTIL